MIEDSVHDAAKAWNTAITKHSLKICNDLPTTDPDYPADYISCGGANSSGTVTVKSVATTAESAAGGCKTSVACATRGSLISVIRGWGIHRGDMEIILEDPGYRCVKGTKDCPNPREYIWTTDPSLHHTSYNKVDGSNGVYAYAPYVLIHEFGHPFGLPDFYKDPELKGFNAIMEGSKFMTIKSEDLTQLYAIYARHDSH